MIQLSEHYWINPNLILEIQVHRDGSCTVIYNKDFYSILTIEQTNNLLKAIKPRYGAIPC